MITCKRRDWSLSDALNRAEIERETICKCGPQLPRDKCWWCRTIPDTMDAVKELGNDGSEGMDSDPKEYNQECDPAYQ